MKCNLLKINGDNTVSTIVWDKPDHTDDQLVVKNIMTGICSSDVAMYSGKMGMLPIGMHGHEGLGEVTEIGKHVKNALLYQKHCLNTYWNLLHVLLTLLKKYPMRPVSLC